MYRPFALSPRAIHLLLILVVILQLVVAAPAVAKDESTRGSAIAAVEDTGSYEDIFEAAENQAPIETKIPSKEETSHQLHVYKLQPLTFAHRVEGILRVIGLGDYTNVILDSLCLLAYAYLLRLTSKSRWYAVEAMQMLGFFCFPALPIIQFTNNLCRTAMRALYDGSSGLRHTLSCVVGQYAVSTPSSPPQLLLNEKLQASESQATTAPLVRQRLTHVMSHELDFSHGPALSLIRRFGGLLLAGLTIVASITTLHIHVDHPVRSDWDSVGIASDQRHGWLSSSATVASLLSVLALLINSRWSIKPEFTTPDAAVGLLGETEIFVELAFAAIAQDIFGGLSGTDSFAGYVSDLTGRWGLLVILVLFAVLNRRVTSFARSLAGSRSPGRRGSATGLSKPVWSIIALLVCLIVGGYHVGGQLMMMRAAASKHVAKTSDLSAGMD